MKYANMNDPLEIQTKTLAKAAGVYGCVECGKCVAVCPMQEMYPGFSIEMSPRGMIKKSLFERGILSDENIWYCTQCNACTDTCPEGVSCRDLIKGLRAMALEKGLVKNVRTCRSCHTAYGSVPIFAYLSDRLKGRLSHYLELCPSCRRDLYLRRNA